MKKESIDIYKVWKNETFTIELNIDGTLWTKDLVNNFEIETKKIFNYLGIEWNDNIKNFYKTAKNRTDISTPSYDQVTSPIYSRSVSRWNNYEKQFQDVKKYLDKWVKKFNYTI